MFDRHTCEFCGELESDPAARYYAAYGMGRSRIVMQSENFVVLPTLGQLFRGSLLIVPRDHIETLAGLSPDVLKDLRRILAACSRRVAELGEVLTYEHGAKQATGGSCGIYHAHAHAVPLPEFISAEVMVPEGRPCTVDFVGALEPLRDEEEYLLVSDSRGSTRVVTIDAANRANYGSQYLRRCMGARFAVDRPWDWRAYSSPELDVMFTIDWFAQTAFTGEDSRAASG